MTHTSILVQAVPYILLPFLLAGIVYCIVVSIRWVYRRLRSTKPPIAFQPWPGHSDKGK